MYTGKCLSPERSGIIGNFRDYNDYCCLCSVPQRYFCPETARPIEAKFHVEPAWDGGMKVCSNGPSHMTNIATTPIYGKTLKKSSSLEPNSR